VMRKMVTNKMVPPLSLPNSPLKWVSDWRWHDTRVRPSQCTRELKQKRPQTEFLVKETMLAYIQSCALALKRKSGTQ
jgi:hypothetical protein